MSGQLTWDWLGAAEPRVRVDSSWPTTGSLTSSWREATGEGARVCILDSGVAQDNTRPGPLAGSFMITTGSRGEPVVTPDDVGDTYGHGTACASIIRRVAPECSVTSMKVLGAGYGAGSTLLAGLAWAIEQRFDVINLSLSTRHERFAARMRELVDEAYFRGIVVVAAAHNSRVESYPWRLSSVVSVGSHQVEDENVLYYNSSPPVEFLAAGRNVRATGLDGADRYWSGNSFAAPLVAGRCALIKSEHPDFTPVQVKCALILSADNVFHGG